MDLYASAVWSAVVLTDAQCEQLAFSLSDWWQIQPSGFWLFDQDAVAQKVVDHTGGGANESARTGTTVGTGSPPLSYGHPIIWTPPFIDTTPTDSDSLALSDDITQRGIASEDTVALSDTQAVDLQKTDSDSIALSDSAVSTCVVVIPTHLTDGASSTNGTVFNTAAVAPGADELALIAVLSNHTSTPSLPTLAGGGMTTWTQVLTVTFGSGSNHGRLTVFRALQASPGGAAAITITHPSSVGACAWSVDKFAGVLTTGTNGADAVRQAVSDNTTSGLPRQNVWIDEMAAFGDPDNMLWGAVGHLVQEATSPYSSFTETADRNNGDATTPGNLETAYGRETEDVSWGWATAAEAGWAGLEIAGVTGCRSPGVPTDFPQFFLEINLNEPTNAVKSWRDISDRVVDWKRSGPKRSFELDPIEAAQLEVKCRNHDRALDPEYGSGPYYGFLYSNMEIRAKWLYKGRWYPIFYGFIEDFDAKNEGFFGQYTTLKANDVTEILHAETLDSGPATLTTSQGSNKDLTFTAKSSLADASGNNLATMKHGHPLGGHHTPPGEGAGIGESLFIEYVMAPHTGHPTTAIYNSETNTITVALINNGGVPDSRAITIRDVVNSNPQCNNLVTVALAGGNDGSGKPAAMSPTPLAGGFSSERSGKRIHRALTSLEHPWPLGDRKVDLGDKQIQASSIEKRSNVSCMTHLQDVGVVTDLGIVYVDEKTRVVFLEGRHRNAQDYPIYAVFTDLAGVGGEYSYHEISPNLPDRPTKHVWNEVVVTSNGSNEPITVEDVDSIARFRKRTKTLTVLCFNTLAAGGAGFENELADVAYAIVDLLAWPNPRYDHLQVDLGPGDPTLDLLLGLKISHRLTIKRHPSAGPGTVDAPIETDHFVEGYDMEQGEDKFVRYTIYLSPYATFSTPV